MKPAVIMAFAYGFVGGALAENYIGAGKFEWLPTLLYAVGGAFGLVGFWSMREDDA